MQGPMIENRMEDKKRNLLDSVFESIRAYDYM